MIISDTYKYVFVEIPRTGSTAISSELQAQYDGKKILHKHAHYHEFLRVASEKQKNYFVFAGIRNPLDEIVSLYSKLLTNHKSAYTNPNNYIENGGWITRKRLEAYRFVQEHASYARYLERFYRLPYTSNINVNAKYCDAIVRFENLEISLDRVFAQLSIGKKRNLPHINKTKKFDDFMAFYKGRECIELAIKIFAPFMVEWGYALPGQRQEYTVGTVEKIKYKLTKTAHIYYSQFVQGGPLQKLNTIRNMVER